MEKNKQTFDQAELALLKEGLKRNYKERFEMGTRLFANGFSCRYRTYKHPFFAH